eukprot:1920903-Prymnesium_polylepis.2
MPRFVDLLAEIGELIISDASGASDGTNRAARAFGASDVTAARTPVVAAGAAAPRAADEPAHALLEMLDADHATPTLVWSDGYRAVHPLRPCSTPRRCSN